MLPNDFIVQCKFILLNNCYISKNTENNLPGSRILNMQKLAI